MGMAVNGLLQCIERIAIRNVWLGQILYGGDDLSGIEWNKRAWISRDEIRANLVDLCLKIATEI